MKILITGGELNNKGAQAMSFICIDNVKRRFPQSEVVLISERDCKLKNKEIYNFRISSGETNFISILYKLGGILKFLKFSKAVTKKRIERMDALYSDAELMLDISGYALGSNWGIRRTGSYISKIILAKAYGIRLYILPQSIGPFDYKGIKGAVIKKALKYLLRYPEKIYARENAGFELLKNEYKLKNVEKSNDIVLTNKNIDLKNIFCEEPKFKEIKIENNSVAIVPNMKNYSYGNKGKILNLYKGIITKILEKKDFVYLISHAVEDITFCHDIKLMFESNENVIIIEEEVNCLEFNQIVSKFDYLIASRFHALVHSYKNSVPCIVLGWAIKYKEMAEIFNQDRFVFNVTENFKNEEVLNMIDDMNNNFKSYSDSIRLKMKEVQKSDVFLNSNFLGNISSVEAMNRDLCVSCGICAGVCPQKCISMERDRGQYIPVIDREKCTLCGLCSSVCSSCSEKYNIYEKNTDFGEEKHFIVWSKDEKIRNNSASGGAITHIISKLLENEEYSCAFCVDSFNYKENVETKRFLKEDNLEKTSKSRYVPISHQKAVEYILANRSERVILCATPCVIHNILSVIDKFNLDRNNYLLLGLFCDKTENNNVFDYFENTEKKKIKELHFKNKEKNGWPGDVQLIFEDCGKKMLPSVKRKEIKDYFQLERCLYCTDKLNRYADISFGDNYTGISAKKGDSGTSNIVVRTKKGSEILSKLENEMELTEIKKDSVEASQQIKKREGNIVNLEILYNKTGFNLHGLDFKKQSSVTRQKLKNYENSIKKIELGRNYPLTHNKIIQSVRAEHKKRTLNRALSKLSRTLRRK